VPTELLALAVEKMEEKKEKEKAEATLIKSRDPHLAGAVKSSNTDSFGEVYIRGEETKRLGA
jgi:hypothetical protein